MLSLWMKMMFGRTAVEAAAAAEARCAPRATRTIVNAMGCRMFASLPIAHRLAIPSYADDSECA